MNPIFMSNMPRNAALNVDHVEDSLVWAVDHVYAAGQPAKKAYCRGTVAQMYDWLAAGMVPANAHCILPPDAPLPFFFDLDCKCERLTEADAEALLADFVLALATALKNLVGINPSHVELFHASTPLKFSVHGIVFDVPLVDMNSCRELAKAVHKHLQRHAPAVADLLDLQVYTCNRCFRLVGCDKLGKGRPLTLVQLPLKFVSPRAFAELCANNEELALSMPMFVPENTPELEATLAAAIRVEPPRCRSSDSGDEQEEEVGRRDIRYIESLVSKIDAKFADPYDSWKEIVWAIANETRHSDEGFELARRFSELAGPTRFCEDGLESHFYAQEGGAGYSWRTLKMYAEGGRSELLRREEIGWKRQDRLVYEARTAGITGKKRLLCAAPEPEPEPEPEPAPATSLRCPLCEFVAKKPTWHCQIHDHFLGTHIRLEGKGPHATVDMIPHSNNCRICQCRLNGCNRQPKCTCGLVQKRKIGV